MSNSRDRKERAFRVIVRYSAAYPDLNAYCQDILTWQCEPAVYTPRIPDDQWLELQSLGANGLMFYPTIPDRDLSDELIAEGYTIFLGSHWVPLHFRARHGVEDGDNKLFDYLLEHGRQHHGDLWWGCASESGINQPEVRWLVGLPKPGEFTTKLDAFEITKAYYQEQALANTGCRHFFYSQKRLQDPPATRDMLFKTWQDADCPHLDGLKPMGFGDIMEHAHYADANMSDYNLIAGDGCHTHTYHYMASFGASRVQGEYNAGCPPCQPSTAFLRGAARMSGIPSMIHWSAWGGSEGDAQSFDQDGQLKCGNSPSLQLRQWVFGWLAGINSMTTIEEATRQLWYHDRDGKRHLTQSAQNMKRFTRLALSDGLPGVSPTDPVKPYVPFALMFEKHHGWTPGHDDIWWGAAQWGKDEDNIRAFFDTAWPSHRMFIGGSDRCKWEQRTKIWQDKADYYRLRAEGLPADDFEKGMMSETRWGDTFDAITEDAPTEMLSQYKVIVLLGGIRLRPDLRIRLQDYVEAGGIVVINAPHINRSAEKCLGVKLNHTYPGSRNDGLPFDITLTDAQALGIITPRPVLTADGKDYPAPLTDVPWVTRVKFGKGKFYLTTLDYAEQGAMDLYAPHFFDSIFGGFIPVKLESKQIDRVSWMLNTLPNGWLLTVMNHGGNFWESPNPDAWRAQRFMTHWTGTAFFPDSEFPGDATSTDLWTGQPIPIAKCADGWQAELSIPPGGFVICSVEK